MLSRVEQRELLEYIKALADDNRLMLVGLLGQSEHNVGDLATRLGITEPTVSHHLAKLRSAGLVNLRAQGSQRIYGLNAAALQRFKTLASGIENMDLRDAQPDDQAWIDALDVSEEDRKVFRDYTSGGRLVQIPTRRKKLLVLLRWLAGRFQAGVLYTEQEVNAIIRSFHDDHTTLRRDLVDFGFLRRERGGGKYWLTPENESAAVED
jgi:DNA-binding HxlR family transcriptional regulator